MPAPLTKEQRRAAMPESTKFIDEMRQHFDLVGIEAEENGQLVTWGESFGPTVAFRAKP